MVVTWDLRAGEASASSRRANSQLKPSKEASKQARVEVLVFAPFPAAFRAGNGRRVGAESTSLQQKVAGNSEGKAGTRRAETAVGEE